MLQLSDPSISLFYFQVSHEVHAGYLTVDSTHFCFLSLSVLLMFLCVDTALNGTCNNQSPLISCSSFVAFKLLCSRIKDFKVDFADGSLRIQRLLFFFFLTERKKNYGQYLQNIL